jgi:hypothetical protein
MGVLDDDDPNWPDHVFGHRTYWDSEGRYLYCDNDEVVTFPTTRPCPKCGAMPTADDHDPCIAALPGVEFACCGHGIAYGYIAFSDGRTIYFTLVRVQP